jgi:hypothetical protein
MDSAGKFLRPLIGRAQVDADLRQAVQAQWVEPRRRIARKVLRRGIESGELREGLDADVVLDVPVRPDLPPAPRTVRRRPALG